MFSRDLNQTYTLSGKVNIFDLKSQMFLNNYLHLFAKWSLRISFYRETPSMSGSLLIKKFRCRYFRNKRIGRCGTVSRIRL